MFNIFKKREKHPSLTFEIRAGLSTGKCIDVGWSWDKLQLEYNESIKQKDYSRSESLLFVMSWNRFNNGFDHIPFLAKMQEMCLYGILKQPFYTPTDVIILTAKDKSCPACQKLEGMRLSVEEALKKKLLPCLKCGYKKDEKHTVGMCRCMYIVVT